MSNSNEITNNLLQSMSIIASQAVNNTNFDKTVQATIVSCIDATIGEYKVKYQDGTWSAFSQNVNTTYLNGTSVYVLIPGGDTRNVKTIIGTTKQLGINYINVINEENKYQKLGTNVITDSNQHGLCSYRSEVITLYDVNQSSSANVIDIDTVAAQTNIKECTHFIVSALVRTNLPVQQRYNGNYGIRYQIDVLDKANAEQGTITRTYILDANNMQGNIYLLTSSIEQTKVFEIEEGTFERIRKIELFVENFPNSAIDKEDDIFISELSFVGAVALSDSELNGVALEIITKNGNIFDDSDTANTTKTIEAQVRVAGRVINNESQKLNFYWYVQNTGINSGSPWYSKYGGQGWKCLNTYKTVAQNTYDFNPGTYTFTIKKSDVTCQKMLYKCVVIYDENTFQKQFYMNNLDASYDVDVFSDSGNQFIANQGSPTLTCVLSGPSINAKYNWSTISSDGSYTRLTDNTTEYNNYITQRTEYNRLVNGFKNGTILRNAYYSGTVTNQTKANQLASTLEELNKKQFVVNNKIYHVNIGEIINFKTFSCTVSDTNDNPIGTDSIKIVNKGGSTDPYVLVLNNGAQVFNYSQDGVSPCESSNENPYIIPELTFTVYNSKGREIPLSAIRAADVEWIIPTQDTMITNPVIGKKSLSYGIQKRYSISKTNNNIELKVTYDNYTMMAKTNFTFTKEGELGTNGTGLVVKIGVFNDQTQVKDAYPWAATSNGISFTFDGSNNSNFTELRAQLWKNGDKIFEDKVNKNSSQGKAVTLTWQMLKNKYTSSITDGSSFNISNGVLSASSGVNLKTLYEQIDAGTGTSATAFANTPANIVKVTLRYDGLVYYATLPIITVYRTDSNFRATLTQNTGFRYVVYGDNGRIPAYDNHLPFTISLSTLVNKVREDISISTVTNYNPIYTFGYLGTIYENGKRISKHYLMNASETGTKNQKYVKPLDSYDGLSVTNALYSIVKIGSKVVFVHMPIHFLLNKYPNSAINEWDGNSVTIDADNTHTILAPQMGAGHKNTDNTFTGIVMGDVKSSGSATKETGLFGYAAGARSIFLDASTGKAEFGVNGKGQILIEPSASKAIIKSGNYNTTNKTGMQIDLSTPEIRFGSGRFIVDSSGNLTATGGGNIAGWTIGDDKLYKGKVGMSSNSAADTNIAFWAGNTTATSAPFRVNYKGEIVASAGTIAGWSINNGLTGSLMSPNKNIGLYANAETGTTTQKAGKSFIWAGATQANHTSAPFRVDGNGKLYATGAQISGSGTFSGQITAKTGYIGNGTSGFTIGNTAIYNGKSSRDDANAGIYLGTNGISLGKSNTFTVTNAGKLTAKDATITGTITATSGKIADWTIDGSILYGKDKKIGLYSQASTSSHSAFWAGSSSHASAPFRVDGTGKLYATGVQISGKITATAGSFTGTITAETGSIANWKIASNKIWSGGTQSNPSMSFGTTGIKLGSNFSVSAAGSLTAKSGTIAGWTIVDDGSKSGLYKGNVGLYTSGTRDKNGYLRVGNFYALSNGTIQGGQVPVGQFNASNEYSAWSITDKGVATFNNATINNGYLAADSIQTVINGSNRGVMSSFFADSATVNNLSANVANINTLVATKASITDLNAAKARISTLETDSLKTADLKAAIGKIKLLSTNGITDSSSISSSGTVFGSSIKAGSGGFKTDSATGVSGHVGGLWFSQGICYTIPSSLSVEYADYARNWNNNWTNSIKMGSAGWADSAGVLYSTTYGNQSYDNIHSEIQTAMTTLRDWATRTFQTK